MKRLSVQDAIAKTAREHQDKARAAGQPVPLTEVIHARIQRAMITHDNKQNR